MAAATFPELNFQIKEGEAGYISEKAIDLILELTKVGLVSQLAGGRQLTTRCGSILTQSIALASASASAGGALFSGVISASTQTKPISYALLAAAIFWIVSAVFAAIGMLGRDFGAPGIEAIDGYDPDVLGIGDRLTKAWAIKALALTKDCGKPVIRSIKRLLNVSIAISIAAPVFAILTGAAVFLVEFTRQCFSA